MHFTVTYMKQFALCKDRHPSDRRDKRSEQYEARHEAGTRQTRGRLRRSASSAKPERCPDDNVEQKTKEWRSANKAVLHTKPGAPTLGRPHQRLLYEV